MAKATPPGEETPAANIYRKSISFIERMYRHLLDMVAAEMDRRGVDDVNSVQAMLLYNIADSEVNAGELRSQGHYLGSNVSYNLKKLTQSNYVHAVRSSSDRRVVRVQLTEKGQKVHALVADLFARQAIKLEEQAALAAHDLEVTNKVLATLAQMWREHGMTGDGNN